MYKIKYLIKNEKVVVVNNADKIMIIEIKDAFIVIYDKTSKYQIKRVSEWITAIYEEMTSRNTVLLILGNKDDLITNYENEIAEMETSVK
jgi:hypothetical protein